MPITFNPLLSSSFCTKQLEVSFKNNRSCHSPHKFQRWLSMYPRIKCKIHKTLHSPSCYCPHLYLVNWSSLSTSLTQVHSTCCSVSLLSQNGKMAHFLLSFRTEFPPPNLYNNYSLSMSFYILLL